MLTGILLIWSSIFNASLYEKGNCDSLAEVYRNTGMTQEEEAFFFGQNILWKESRCGLTTYNKNSGDTGTCQLTHLHSKPGYYAGEYWPRGWARDLFGLEVGKAHNGKHKDHHLITKACLWLLRGGSFEPGAIDKNPWKASW